MQKNKPLFYVLHKNSRVKAIGKYRVIGIQLKQLLIENNNVFYPISPKSKIHLKLNFRKFKH